VEWDAQVNGGQRRPPPGLVERGAGSAAWIDLGDLRLARLAMAIAAKTVAVLYPQGVLHRRR